VVRECISSLGGAHDFNFSWSKFIVVFSSIRIEQEVISVSVKVILIRTRFRIWADWGVCRAVGRQVQRSEAILFVLGSLRRSRVPCLANNNCISQEVRGGGGSCGDIHATVCREQFFFEAVSSLPPKIQPDPSDSSLDLSWRIFQNSTG